MKRGARLRARTTRASCAGLVVISATLLGGCRGKVTHAECMEMLDRYVDMSIAADPSLAGLTPQQAADVRDMKKAVKKGEKSYVRVEQQCEREISRKEYDCAMKAPNPNEWEACID